MSKLRSELEALRCELAQLENELSLPSKTTSSTALHRRGVQELRRSSRSRVDVATTRPRRKKPRHVTRSRPVESLPYATGTSWDDVDVESFVAKSTIGNSATAPQCSPHTLPVTTERQAEQLTSMDRPLFGQFPLHDSLELVHCGKCQQKIRIGLHNRHVCSLSTEETTVPPKKQHSIEVITTGPEKIVTKPQPSVSITILDQSNSSSVDKTLAPLPKECLAPLYAEFELPKTRRTVAWLATYIKRRDPGLERFSTVLEKTPFKIMSS